MATPITPVTRSTNPEPSSPLGPLPQGLSPEARAEVLEGAVRAYRTGQQTDASSRLPDDRGEQNGLIARQSLQGQIPGSQNPVQIPSSTINTKIAVNRA